MQAGALGSFEIIDAAGTPAPHAAPLTPAGAGAKPLAAVASGTPQQDPATPAPQQPQQAPPPSPPRPRPPPVVPAKPREAPLTRAEWAALLDHEGRITDVAAFRSRVFYGGLDPSLRREVWPHLLGVHKPGSTAAERAQAAAGRETAYRSVLQQWQSITDDQSRRFSKFRERRSQIEKDVVRTDRKHELFSGEDNPNLDLLRRALLTYSFYNFDLVRRR